MLMRDIITKRAYISPDPRPLPSIPKKKKRRGLFIVGGGVGFVVLLVSFYFSRADTLSFYPTACLGTWVDTKHVEGAPDGVTSKLTSFGADIFCGSFGGDIPADTVPKSFVLRFAWRFTEVANDSGAQPSNYSEAATTSPADIPAVEAQSEREMSASTSPNTVITPIGEEEAPTPEAPPVAEGSHQESESLPVEQPTVPEEAPLSEPVSLLDWFVRPAHAQGSSESDASIELVEQATSSVSSVMSSTTTVEHLGVKRDALFEVYYTLDGSTWQSLGVVDRVSLSTIEFPLPLEAWSDLARVQIRIVSLPTVFDVPAVELDSIWIETAYAEQMRDPMTPPDFRRDVLLDTHTTDGLQAVKIMRPQGEVEIWYRTIREDNSGGDWQRVAGSEYLVERNTPFAIHSKIIFWTNQSRGVLYSFHILAGGYQSQTYDGQIDVELGFRDLATESWGALFDETNEQFEFLRSVTEGNEEPQ